MAKGTKVKTKKGDLVYTFIKGEGRNAERDKTKPPKWQYVASILTKKDSEIHKHMLEQVMAEWASYKEQHGVKGLPKSTGIKEEMVKDPKGEIDPNTEEIKRIPTGNVLITFKTNTKWPDNSPHIVKVYDGKGKDITEAVHKADWGIGQGSTGIIHGLAQGNNVGGDHKVSLYLSAVQLAKLVKYEGSEVETEEIDDAEEIDLGDSVAAIDESDSATPDL